jgi:hypothetical protein
MSEKQTFYRIIMLQEFLVKVQAAKEVLLGELVTRASDPVILKRRFRMLSQLALYESIVVSKIYNLETEDNSDFLNLSYIKHINTIIDKSA